MVRLVVFAFVLFVVPDLAPAAPISDPSQLSPNCRVVDFEHLSATAPLPNPLTIGNVTFASVTGTLSILDVAVSGWSANGTAVNDQALFPGGEPDSAIVITFADPVSEVLLGWGDPNFSGNRLLAYDANGNLLETASPELGPPGGVHAAWVGFKRAIADIARLVVQPDQSLPNGDDFVIDNIRYKTVDTVIGNMTFTNGVVAVGESAVGYYAQTFVAPATTPKALSFYLASADHSGPMNFRVLITEINGTGSAIVPSTVLFESPTLSLPFDPTFPINRNEYTRFDVPLMALSLTPGLTYAWIIDGVVARDGIGDGAGSALNSSYSGGHFFYYGDFLTGSRASDFANVGGWNDFDPSEGRSRQSLAFEMAFAPSPLGGPATKDQCKKDGWKAFTFPRTFKNQGDCVSFVNNGR